MTAFNPDPPFGPVLRRLRQERGYTIDEAAKRAQVTANYLGDVERGQRNPTMKVVGRILAGLRVSWVEFAQRLESSADVHPPL
ncbi:MAG TPA: helix-turn-helix transcriptional regulator [Longimicrobium sp.]|jgi:transcriptional regulator with XRE-family HTH domain|uniref:helix-turn-helix domain-containing protein n=1 Tax=Longimicrobium sp. TaxID=2029185 RepID=UPI002ED87735